MDNEEEKLLDYETVLTAIDELVAKRGSSLSADTVAAFDGRWVLHPTGSQGAVEMDDFRGDLVVDDQGWLLVGSHRTRRNNKPSGRGQWSIEYSRMRDQLIWYVSPGGRTRTFENVGNNSTVSVRIDNSGAPMVIRLKKNAERFLYRSAYLTVRRGLLT